MNAGQGFVKLGVCGLLTIMMIGCASEKRKTSDVRSGAAYEHDLNREWAGKPYTDLLAAYGEPEVVMNIPSSGTNTAVVVYPVIKKMPAKCTHAFTIQRGAEPKVVRYACQ
jgi:hypothetical protein